MENDRSINARNFQHMSATAEMLGDAVAEFLGRRWGQFKSCDKTAARELGVTPRTIRNWRTRQCTPHGAQLVELMARNEVLRAEINGLVQQLRAELDKQHDLAARVSRQMGTHNRVILSAADSMDREAAALDRRSGAWSSEQATEPRDQARAETHGVDGIAIAPRFWAQVGWP